MTEVCNGCGEEVARADAAWCYGCDSYACPDCVHRVDGTTYCPNCPDDDNED